MFEQYEEYLNYEIGGHLVEEYLWNLLLFFLILFGFKLFKRFVLGRLKKFAKRTATDFDDNLVLVIEDIPEFVYYLAALYFPLDLVVTNLTATSVIDGIYIVVFVWQAIKAIQRLLEYGLSKYFTVSQADLQASTTFYGVKLIVRLVLWVTGLLLVLSNLGFDVTSLVASLGIGGIAVALAVQNVLGDIFSSFSIYFDKPFKIGDFIVVGEHSGTVEKIGLKTTRITTLHGEELVIANNELTKVRIHNYKKMKKRRIAQIIGVEYGTTNKKLEKAKEIMKKAVESVDEVEYDRCFFYEFGPHSLNFELVYYILSQDMAFALERQEKVNMYINEQFAKAKIGIAFPTQTIFVKK